MNVNFILELVMKAHIGSTGGALLFFRPGARCAQVVNSTLQLPYVQERDLGPSCVRLIGHQDHSGRVWKILLPPGFDPHTLQPIASCYTEYDVLTYSNKWL